MFVGPIRSWLLCLAAAAACAGAAGCSHDQGDPQAGADVVRFELDFGGGVNLASVDYILTGPGDFRRVGTLAVGDQPSVTATFQNLPPGQGYKIQVRGTASDDTSGCKGEMTFDVTASMNAALQIPLTCTGLAAVGAVIDVCPVIDSLSAIPSEVRVGGSIQVTAEVHDADDLPAALSGAWVANGGALSNRSREGVTFTCTAPGTFTVGLRVSDRDGANGCADTSTIVLVCSV